ncbi:FUSC family protein [Micromonospora sp. WMMD812]|uniref:FUSC family protein n=1 Tax=Micromonospora sp. WMMD812 TaxID=3015152 RepID=UPI00248BEDAA|nr:FUSC family protein [Micromonospora sp. WMMD812]WBB65293.1 FUSC family protein [Micromonospora sp. WMMD812]
MAQDRPAAEPARSPLGAVAERGGEHVARARHLGGEAGKIRLRQLEVTGVIAVQSGLASALAALLAQHLLGPGAHVFAPAAAVATIATAIGQRARRTFELLAGVGLGIVIGDLLRFALGSGPWQTGLVVALAIATALLVAGRGGALVGQAGGTAVLISTLAPMERGLEVPRILDALVGTGIGLLVVALLLPVNPIRVLDRAATPIFDTVTQQLDTIAAALRQRDAHQAIGALERLRGLEADVGRLNEALSGAEEVVTLAPARWHRRAQYHRYARGATHLERFALDVRVLARWSSTAIQYDEPIPEELPAAMTRLGQAARVLREDCSRGEKSGRTRALTLEAADLAGRAWAEGVRSFGEALITDLRAASSDLLRADGYEPEEANRLVRTSAGAGEAAVRPPVHRRLHRTGQRRFSTGADGMARRSALRASLGRRTGRARGIGRAGLPRRGSPAR